MSARVLGWVGRQKFISRRAKLVMLKLADCAADDGCCSHPTSETIMEFAMIDSIRDLQKEIKRLADDGHIEFEGWVKRDGRKRRSWRIILSSVRDRHTTSCASSRDARPPETHSEASSRDALERLPETHTPYIITPNIITPNSDAEIQVSETTSRGSGSATTGESGQVRSQQATGRPYWAKKLPIQVGSWLDNCVWTEPDQGVMTIALRHKAAQDAIEHNPERLKMVLDAARVAYSATKRLSLHARS